MKGPPARRMATPAARSASKDAIDWRAENVAAAWTGPCVTPWIKNASHRPATAPAMVTPTIHRCRELPATARLYAAHGRLAHWLYGPEGAVFDIPAVRGEQRPSRCPSWPCDQERP